MTLTNLLQLAMHDLRATRGRSVVSTLGIAFGVGVLVMIVALGLGARELVLKQVVRELPIDMIEIVPKRIDLGLFKVDAGALFGSQPLDPAAVERLRKLPNVQAVYPKLQVSLPMSAHGGAQLFGRSLYTDIFMTGVPEELMRSDTVESFSERDGILPVIISDQLIEIYNTSVAPAVDGPQLTPATLTGFEFEITFGRSIIMGTRGATRIGSESARVVGASRYAMRLGATVPIETARRLMRTYGQADSSETYTAVLVKAASGEAMPEVARNIEALGFAIDQSAAKARDLLTVSTALASLVGVLVLVLAALNIAHSFIALLGERRRELAILRAVGARGRDLISLVLTQATLLGAAGGLLGLFMARLASFGVDAAVHAFIPHLPFAPDTFFIFPAWLHAAGLGAAVMAALLGALWPAVRAARVSVARVLAEG